MNSPFCLLPGSAVTAAVITINFNTILGAHERPAPWWPPLIGLIFRPEAPSCRTLNDLLTDRGSVSTSPNWLMVDEIDGDTTASGNISLGLTNSHFA